MNLCPFPLLPPPSLARVQMYLEKKIETEITNAKKHAAKNKTGKSFDSDANGNNAACSETLLHHAAADTSLPPPRAHTLPLDPPLNSRHGLPEA